MSESVLLISSHSIELEELHPAILSARGKTGVLVNERGYGQLGAVIDGKRRILISGYRHPSDDPSFWEGQLPYFGQGMLEEIQKKLGANLLGASLWK